MEEGEAANDRKAASTKNVHPAHDANSKYSFPSINPTQFLLISSIPIAAGAFAGYRRELKHASSRGDGGVGGGLMGKQMMGVRELPSAVQLLSQTAARSTAEGFNPAGLAARALVIGSMLSISGVGILSAGKTTRQTSPLKSTMKHGECHCMI